MKKSWVPFIHLVTASLIPSWDYQSVLMADDIALKVLNLKITVEEDQTIALDAVFDDDDVQN